MPLGLAALDSLGHAFEDLRRVLGGNDPQAIEAATARVAEAAASVQAIGAWRSDPELTERLHALAPLIESARIRVALLADHAGQRLSALAAHGATAAPLTYGR
ncbi:hypothetical protein SAMIE_1024290 [Sphingobium amiense]|uniref:Uncharacterized protein n=1 Tax=Sphingobium amiense TaxID=135719 RepID=A0A494W6V3_9SPHN|nr:hypothetical protein [Sphingobium amiense]BBD98928.1 hypothetical protein SAMIE_1024290 [Sphingobium amiense]